MSTFYVTTPIYYVNDLPHVGHIYTTVVADVMARYQRLAGHEVYFLTGTDEHGQNIERAAEREGVQPIELADRVVERYHQLWRQLDISHDDFIRTTEPRHHAGVHEMIRLIDAAGDFYTARHEGWYCSPCETFYTEKELLEGNRCPIHELPVEWQSEENLFFRLSRYQQPLLDFYAANPGVLAPESRANEVVSFVSSGLRDLSVSRAAVEWGVPWPEKDGQTVYVWLDALTNYISALGFGSTPADAGDGDEAGAELYRRFWSGGDRRVHLVGKDILRHHAVYWPAFLMSAGLPLPTLIYAHGFWLLDARKISKSAGNIARPDHLIERFGADPLRYYLMRDMVFGQDASYSDEAFVERFNSDLANDLGNTVSRVVTLCRNGFDGKTPPPPADEGGLEAVARQAVADYRQAMEEPAFSRAIEALQRLLSETNGYLVSGEPWKLLKDPATLPQAGAVLWNALEALRVVATGLLPVMPGTARRILAAIGVPDPERGVGLDGWGGIPGGAELPEPEPLFPRIDKKAYLAELSAGGDEQADDSGEESQEEKVIDIEQFFKTELKVGTVQTAEAIPKSNKLLKLTVDLGEEEPRTVVAGIAKQYEPEALVGKQVVVVANLQPAKLMGVESQGMVLAASEDGAPVLLHPEKPVPVGTVVR